MTKPDPRVLAELGGEQQTDQQTPPAGPSPEVVERMARVLPARKATGLTDLKAELEAEAAEYQAAIDAAVKAEREACAAVLDEMAAKERAQEERYRRKGDFEMACGFANDSVILEAAAAAIRARSNPQSGDPK